MTDVGSNGALPPRPLLELMLRAREGVSRYRPWVASTPQPEIDPAREMNRWLQGSAISNPTLQEYLNELVPPESHRYVLNRIVDLSRSILYLTLEPWRVGRRWADFELYAEVVVNMVCWTAAKLDETPCDPVHVSGA